MKLGKINTYQTTPYGIILTDKTASLKIEFVTSDILRMWTTLKDDFYSDETLVVEKTEFNCPHISIEEKENRITLTTDTLSACINLDPFFLKIQDLQGKNIFSTPCDETISWEDEKLTQRFDLPKDTSVYGLGQSSYASLNLRGMERRMWHQWDGFRYSGNAGIPFMMTSQGYGLLLNSSWASRFVLAEGVPTAKTKLVTPKDLWGDEPSSETHPERGAILLEGGDMDIFIIHGPDYPSIMQRYADLVGKPPVIPKWALGYMQSKFGYKNQDETLEVANQMRRQGFAGDVIIIDLDWFRYFADLDWVKPYWPNPTEMIRQLRSMGFRTIVVSEPFVDTRSLNFKEFDEKGYLYNWSPTEVTSPVDLCHYAVDQTNPKARALWWEKLKKLFDQGIRGFWCDMGEPQTHPVDSPDQYLGCREKVHNIYSVAWSKGIYEGQRSYTNERPFTLFRTMYVGMHRYSAATWSGDVDYTWKVLADQIVVGQQVCLSGQPYWGTDVGGCMYQDYYDPELYARWFEWGAFCPIFRTHGVRYNNEPWSFGKPLEDIIRKYIDLRYTLMPYTYTYAYETAKTYAPMMRAMFYAFPNDEKAVASQHQFMFGDSILVAPVTEKGHRTKEVYLPEGIWYHFWTDEQYTGKQSVETFAPLDTLPLFVKGGAIIPTVENTMHTNGPVPEKLTVHIYPGANGDFTLYEDDGYTYAYEKNQCALTQFTYNDETQEINIAATKGVYAGMPYARTYEIVYHDCKLPESIFVNGTQTQEDTWTYHAENKLLKITLEQIPANESILLKVLPDNNVALASLNEEEISLRYDVEYFEETADKRLSCLIRVYTENIFHEPVEHSASITTPVGWCCTSQEQETLRTGQTISKFHLCMDGREFTSTATVQLNVSCAGQSFTKDIPLLSGWITWWKLAGPYKYGPSGFDTEFLPEKNYCIDENNVEDGVRVVDFKRFECFGYVPVQRVYTEQNLEGAVANFTPDCIDRTCYASCTATLPEDRECILKLMGEDKLKVWVNGKLLLAIDQCHGTPIYSRVKLKAGKNQVFVKCSQFNNREAEVWSERSWGFYCTFVDENRNPVEDIVYLAE